MIAEGQPCKEATQKTAPQRGLRCTLPSRTSNEVPGSIRRGETMPTKRAPGILGDHRQASRRGARSRARPFRISCRIVFTRCPAIASTRARPSRAKMALLAIMLPIASSLRERNVSPGAWKPVAGALWLFVPRRRCALHWVRCQEELARQGGLRELAHRTKRQISCLTESARCFE